MAHEPVVSPPSLREFLGTFGYIGVNSFGGPAGQIAVMHRVLVDKKRWLSEDRFLHALNYCMLLPGPEAMQLATYAGWLMRGTWGGVIAGLLFVMPGALVMLALSAFYFSAYDIGLVAAIFAGIKPAVLAIVLEALLRVSRRALKLRAHYVIAVAAFAALFLFAVPFPLVIVFAGIAGMRWGTTTVPTSDDSLLTLPSPGVNPIRHIVQTVAVWGTLWWAPVIFAQTQHEPLIVTLGLFFSKAAVLTFGGAYVVLSFIAQDVVNKFHWLEPGQMMDGLGLAETTPGPLILVNQFVGFLAGAQHSHPDAPLWGGLLGAAMATWATFVPCFLWIFLGAPFIEALRGNQRLSAALSGITASVVGVIANLSVWFSIHTLFAKTTLVAWGPIHTECPQWSTLSPSGMVLAFVASVLLLSLHVPMLAVLALSGAAGVALHYAF